MASDLYNVPVVANDGSLTTLQAYQGRVLLIVNVASRCGFTAQYAELEQLYRDYRDRGLTVLGFPCNQFLHQEPGDNGSIRSFATSCFHVTFPLFGKLDVRGRHQAPLYAYLKRHIEKKPWIFIPWNFTKVLIDAEGNVKRRFLPITPIKTIRKEIDALI